MSNNKLLSVSILAIERERASCLNTDEIIEAFAAAHKNRRIIFL